MKETEAVGLRDRKRQATRKRLERAAIDIVAASGLDALTIDAISERADVSPRTFFNYFDSKEDAILGIRLAGDVTAQLEQTMTDMRPTSLRDGVLTLFADFLEDASHDPELRAARRTVLREHPDLLQRRFAKMGALFGTLTRSVYELMQRTARPEDPPPTESEARVVLMACGAAVHSAVMEMSCQEKGGLPDGSPGPAVRARAEQLLEETMGRLK